MIIKKKYPRTERLKIKILKKSLKESGWNSEDNPTYENLGEYVRNSPEEFIEKIVEIAIEETLKLKEKTIKNDKNQGTSTKENIK